MKESYPGAQAVVRSLRLLKLFREQRSAWTLADIVQRIELNKTTVFRLLSALESEGFVEKSENGTYCLGPEMVALGGRAMMTNNLRQVAQPILAQLVENTGERATLEQPMRDVDGQTAMVIALEIQGKHLISINHYVGSRVPLHATSTGKALLAFTPKAERAALLPPLLKPFTPQTNTDVAQLEIEFNQIREQGYAVAIGELEAGLLAVGAPIKNYTGQPVAAISIEGPDTRLDEDRLHQLAPLVKQASREISYRLGYRDSDDGQ